MSQGQAAEELHSGGSVTGHDFSRADKANEINRDLQAAKKPHLSGFVTGHDFSRADKANKINGLYRLRKNSIRGTGFVRFERARLQSCQ
jgi:hypothetical protein